MDLRQYLKKVFFCCLFLSIIISVISAIFIKSMNQAEIISSVNEVGQSILSLKLKFQPPIKLLLNSTIELSENSNTLSKNTSINVIQNNKKIYSISANNHGDISPYFIISVIKVLKLQNIKIDYRYNEISFFYIIISCSLFGIVLGIICTIFCIIIKFIYLKGFEYFIKFVEKPDCYSWNVKIYLLNSLILFLVISLTIWSLFCGLMFSDEAFFYLMAKAPSDVLLTGITSEYFRFTHYLYVIAGGNIILFRFTSILLNLFACFFFIYEFIKIFKYFGLRFDENLQKYLFSVLVYISSSYLFIHHFNPDYNLLSNSICLIQIPIIILILNSSLRFFRYNFLSFLLGFITGINLYIRFPAFILSLILIFFLFSYFKKYREVIFLIAGILFSFILYFLCIQHPNQFFEELISSIEYSSLVGGHPIKLILLKNCIDIVIFVLQAIFSVLVFNYLAKNSKFHISDVLLWLIIVVLGINLTILGLFPDMVKYFVSTSRMLLIVLILIISENIKLYSCIDKSEKFKFKKIFVVCFILFTFLFISNLGTDTPIFYHILYNSVFIYVGILLQFSFMNKSNRKLLVLLSVLIVYSSCIFIEYIQFNNYRYKNLFEQNVKYQVGNSYLFTDKNISRILTVIKQQLANCGYREGDYIRGYYHLNDIIYAVNGRAAVTPLYARAEDERNVVKANLFLNKLMSNITESKIFIITYESVSQDEIGLNLKNDYLNCGEVERMNAETWFGYGEKKLLLYRHK